MINKKIYYIISKIIKIWKKVYIKQKILKKYLKKKLLLEMYIKKKIQIKILIEMITKYIYILVIINEQYIVNPQ